MNNKFAPEGLHALLNKSHDAKEFFNSLPDYVQDMIEQRSDSVQSMDELRRYADNLLSGD